MTVPAPGSHPRPRTFTQLEADTWWAWTCYAGDADPAEIAEVNEADPVSVLTWCFAYQAAGLLERHGVARWRPCATLTTLEAAEAEHDAADRWQPAPVRRRNRQAWAVAVTVAAVKVGLAT